MAIPSRAQHVDAVGEPKLDITYQGTSTDPRGYVFAQIVDEQRHVVLGNQVTPIAIELDGLPLGLALAGGRGRRHRARRALHAADRGRVERRRLGALRGHGRSEGDPPAHAVRAPVASSGHGQGFDAIYARLAAWIARQRMFFVATAPSGDGGHVNVSPKGPIETLRVLDEHTVAYLDLVGSGAETVAHLQRQRADRGHALRLRGAAAHRAPARPAGGCSEPGIVDFPDAVVLPEQRRTVIRVEVQRIADSCGFGVPLMAYEGERPQSQAWAETKLAKGGLRALEDYVAEKNAVSIDGLPALG